MKYRNRLGRGELIGSADCFSFLCPTNMSSFLIASPLMSVRDGHVRLVDVAFDFLAARYIPARYITCKHKGNEA